MKQIEDLIKPLHDALAVDGAALRVVGVDGSRLRLCLDTTAATCAECVVPDEMIESMVLARLRSEGGDAAPAIDRVEIEHAGEAPA